MLMVSTLVGMLSGSYELLDTVRRLVEVPLAFLIGYDFSKPPNIGELK
jgi:hypothetical protein